MGADVMSLQDFQDIRTKSFHISQLEDPIELELLEATKLKSGGLNENGFSLLWQGPLTPALSQATYTLDHAELGARSYFIVPIGKTEAGYQYEAIFT